MLIKEVNEILKAKCSKSFFTYVEYDSHWTVANGSLNPDLFFSDSVHLVGKGNLKLAESIFTSIENCNGVTVSFKLNNFDFPLYLFLLCLNLFPLPISLSIATACRSSSYVSTLSHKSLFDPTNVCDGAVCSSNVYPCKPVHPSKPVCLSNVRPGKPIISSNFYVSKPVCPRNICSGRSARSSDAGQS